MDSKLAKLIAQLQEKEHQMYNPRAGTSDIDLRRAEELGNATIGYDYEVSGFPPNKKLIDLTTEDVQNHFFDNQINPSKAGIISPKQIMLDNGFSDKEITEGYSDVAKELGKLRYKRLKSVLGR
jgi:hypothetical protein